MKKHTLKRTEEIHIRVSPEERSSMEAQANALGLSISAWARMTLLKSKGQ